VDTVPADPIVSGPELTTTLGAMVSLPSMASAPKL
jgi:hypothetical protein